MPRKQIAGPKTMPAVEQPETRTNCRPAAGKKRSLRDEIARQPNPAPKMDLHWKLALLEHVLERFDESGAMV